MVAQDLGGKLLRITRYSEILELIPSDANYVANSQFTNEPLWSMSYIMTRSHLSSIQECPNNPQEVEALAVVLSSPRSADPILSKLILIRRPSPTCVYPPVLASEDLPTEQISIRLLVLRLIMFQELMSALVKLSRFTTIVQVPEEAKTGTRKPSSGPSRWNMPLPSPPGKIPWARRQSWVLGCNVMCVSS